MGEITLVGIDAQGVTEPSGDSSRGSALYSVPILLSGAPSAEWARFFVEAWNNPESFTTKHRPGIASVVGNKVVLKGTTLEEVAEAHIPTLKAAVKRANEQTAQRRSEQDKQAEAKRQGSAEFRKHVQEMSEKIKFD